MGGSIDLPCSTCFIWSRSGSAALSNAVPHPLAVPSARICNTKMAITWRWFPQPRRARS